jgi:hypothetical protein
MLPAPTRLSYATPTARPPPRTCVVCACVLVVVVVLLLLVCGAASDPMRGHGRESGCGPCVLCG